MAELEKLRKQVKKNYKFLVNDTELERYLDGLIEEDYFDTSDRELVMHKPTTADRNRTFLDLLFKKNPKALNVFLNELHEGNRGDVVDRIKDTPVEVDDAGSANNWWVNTNGLPPGIKFNERFLLKVVKCFSVAKIYEVGACLGLSRPEIDQCVMAHPISPTTQAHAMLVKWKNRNSLHSDLLDKLVDCFKELSGLIEIDQNLLQEAIDWLKKELNIQLIEQQK